MSEAIMDPRTDRKARRAWYLYDFGNSAYAAVVLLAVYSVYFSSVVADHVRGPSLWNLAVGIAASPCTRVSCRKCQMQASLPGSHISPAHAGLI